MKPKLTYANVVSTLALLGVIGGGTAFGAGYIGSPQIINNSVKSKDIRNGTIVGADVGANALNGNDITGLTGADVVDESLGSEDLSDAAKTALLPAVAYDASQGIAVNNVAPADTVKTESVAPGSYFVIGVMDFTNSTGGALTASCLVRADDTQAGYLFSESIPANDDEKLIIMGSATFAAAGTLELECYSSAGSLSAEAQIMVQDIKADAWP